MRKIVLISTLLLLSHQTFAQDSKPISYSEVVTADGVKPDDLFNRARAWFTDYYRSGKEVIQTADKASGEITGNAVTDYTFNNFFLGGAVMGYIRYQVAIYVKDGRYKYELKDFRHDAARHTTKHGQVDLELLTTDEECPCEHLEWGQGSYRKKPWVYAKTVADEAAHAAIASLKAAMAKPSAKEENW